MQRKSKAGYEYPDYCRFSDKVAARLPIFPSQSACFFLKRWPMRGCKNSMRVKSRHPRFSCTFRVRVCVAKCAQKIVVSKGGTKTLRSLMRITWAVTRLCRRFVKASNICQLKTSGDIVHNELCTLHLNPDFTFLNKWWCSLFLPTEHWLFVVPPNGWTVSRSGGRS